MRGAPTAARVSGRAWLRAMVLVLALGAGGCDAPRDRRDVVVFAAASLTDALGAVIDSFEVAHPGYRVLLNVAGTPLLARQVAGGAPADLFFSASPEWMDDLAARGRVVAPVREPLGNRLVVVGAEGQEELPTPAALARVDRLALADPSQVPAGQYARQALECLGLWADVAPRVIPLLDVRAALLAVQQRAASAGIVYASDVRVASGVEVLFELPAPCQPDVRYAVARLRDGPEPEGAAALWCYLLDPARAATWARFGFEPRLFSPPTRADGC